MTKRLKTLFLLVVLVGLFVGATAAFAHHNTVTEWANCEGYLVKADYVGGSGLRKVVWDVDVSVDGLPTEYSGSWEGVSSGFQIFKAEGTGAHDVEADGFVKMYQWRWIIRFLNWGEWRLVDADYFNLDFDDNTCYQTCDETEPVYGEWSGWVADFEAELETREMTVTYVDARDGQTVCGSGVETDSRPLLKTFKAHQAVDCEKGVHRVIHGYMGPEGEPYKYLTLKIYNVWWPFTDDAGYETIPEHTEVIPDGYGESYTFSAVDEPTNCHDFEIRKIVKNVCNDYWLQKVNLRDNRDGRGHVEVLYNSGKQYWTDPYSTEYGRAAWTFDVPDELGEDVFFEEMVEGSCLPEPTVPYIVEREDCSGWDVFLPEGSPGEVVSGETSGDWTVPHELEIATTTIVVDWYGDVDGETEFELSIKESRDCESCIAGENIRKVKYMCYYKDGTPSTGYTDKCWVYTHDGSKPDIADVPGYCEYCEGAFDPLLQGCEWVKVDMCTGDVHYSLGNWPKENIKFLLGTPHEVHNCDENPFDWVSCD